MSDEDKTDELGRQFVIAARELYKHAIIRAVPPEGRPYFRQKLAEGEQVQMTVIMLPTVRIVCRIGGDQPFAFDVKLEMPIDPMTLN